MKTTGIILIVFGALSVFGGLAAAAAGRNPQFGGLAFVVLGAFLISRANKKKEEMKKKIQWEQIGRQGPAESPVKIVNPREDLTMDQKYAIMGLFAFIQGFSSHSAYSEEANDITKSMASLLGLTFPQVASYLQSHHDNANKLIEKLKTIGDRDLLNTMYRKCHMIAKISLEIGAEEVLDHIFKDLGYTVNDIVNVRSE